MLALGCADGCKNDRSPDHLVAECMMGSCEVHAGTDRTAAGCWLRAVQTAAGTIGHPDHLAAECTIGSCEVHAGTGRTAVGCWLWAGH